MTSSHSGAVDDIIKPDKCFMHLVPAVPSVKIPSARSRAGKGTGAHSVFSREKAVVSHAPIPPKSSLKHSVAELCNMCGVVHNAKCKCEFREGNKGYTPNDGMIAASKSLLCRTDGLSIVPEAEIFLFLPIIADAMTLSKIMGGK